MLCLYGFPANAIGLFLFALFRARWHPYSHWRAPALTTWIQWSHLRSVIFTIYERSNVPIIAYNLQLHSQHQGLVHVIINGNRVCLCLTFKSSWSSHSRDHLYAMTTSTWHSSSVSCVKYVWWFYFQHFFTDFYWNTLPLLYSSLFSADSPDIKGVHKMNCVVGQQRRTQSKELWQFFMCYFSS